MKALTTMIISPFGNGSFAYPDLSSISFSSSGTTTGYKRNGRIVADNKSKEIAMAFQRKGAMIFMFGFNETNGKMPEYFGVLTTSGKQMMMYSNVQEARLPSTRKHMLKGVTTVIIKQ